MLKKIIFNTVILATLSIVVACGGAGVTTPTTGTRAFRTVGENVTKLVGELLANWTGYQTEKVETPDPNDATKTIEVEIGALDISTLADDAEKKERYAALGKIITDFESALATGGSIEKEVSKASAEKTDAEADLVAVDLVELDATGNPLHPGVADELDAYQTPLDEATEAEQAFQKLVDKKDGLKGANDAKTLTGPEFSAYLDNELQKAKDALISAGFTADQAVDPLNDEATEAGEKKDRLAVLISARDTARSKYDAALATLVPGYAVDTTAAATLVTPGGPQSALDDAATVATEVKNKVAARNTARGEYDAALRALVPSYAGDTTAAQALNQRTKQQELDAAARAATEVKNKVAVRDAAKREYDATLQALVPGYAVGTTAAATLVTPSRTQDQLDVAARAATEVKRLVAARDTARGEYDVSLQALVPGYAVDTTAAATLVTPSRTQDQLDVAARAATEVKRLVAARDTAKDEYNAALGHLIDQGFASTSSEAATLNQRTKQQELNNAANSAANVVRLVEARDAAKREYDAALESLVTEGYASASTADSLRSTMSNQDANDRHARGLLLVNTRDSFTAGNVDFDDAVDALTTAGFSPTETEATLDTARDLILQENLLIGERDLKKAAWDNAKVALTGASQPDDLTFRAAQNLETAANRKRDGFAGFMTTRDAKKLAWDNAKTALTGASQPDDLTFRAAQDLVNAANLAKDSFPLLKARDTKKLAWDNAKTALTGASQPDDLTFRAAQNLETLAIKAKNSFLLLKDRDAKKAAWDTAKTNLGRLVGLSASDAQSQETAANGKKNNFAGLMTMRDNKMTAWTNAKAALTAASQPDDLSLAAAQTVEEAADRARDSFPLLVTRNDKKSDLDAAIQAIVAEGSIVSDPSYDTTRAEALTVAAVDTEKKSVEDNRDSGKTLIDARDLAQGYADDPATALNELTAALVAAEKELEDALADAGKPLAVAGTLDATEVASHLKELGEAKADAQSNLDSVKDHINARDAASKTLAEIVPEQTKIEDALIVANALKTSWDAQDPTLAPPPVVATGGNPPAAGGNPPAAGGNPPAAGGAGVPANPVAPPVVAAGGAGAGANPKP